MTVLNPAWVLLPWLLALVTVSGLSRLRPLPPEPGRFATIDGLRGHLAFGVFLHHGVIWHGFLRSGQWTAPPSAFFNHLGQDSVVLFFMVTAFLFVGRLLDARERPVDWLRLYVSRVMRLAPLYLLAMAVLFALCGVLTDWERQVPARELRRALRHWLFFSIGGRDNINGVPNTLTLIAGVTWSLPLEWTFYLLLPTLALLMRRTAPLWLAGVALVCALGIWANNKEPTMLWAFAGGGLVAWWVRRPAQRAWAPRPWHDGLLVLALAAAVLSAPTVHHTAPILLLTLAFGLIASGCDLFGLLRLRVSQQLGDLAYSIYLLHGLLLFISLTFVLGRAQAGAYTPQAHWLWLSALAPTVVTIAWLAFHTVERPAMRATDAWAARVRRLFTRMGLLA